MTEDRESISPRIHVRDEILRLIRSGGEYSYHDIQKIVGTTFTRRLAKGPRFIYIVNRILDGYVLPKLEEKEKEAFWAIKADYEHRLRTLERIDIKTGVLTYQYFFNELPKFIKKNQQLRIMFLDLDHFKQCNDDYSYADGDAVLGEMGRLLNESFGKSSLIGRYGGEEFVIAVPESAMAMDVQFQQLREGYQKFVTSRFTKPGSLFRGTFSVGIYNGNFSDPNESIEMAIERVDKALHIAKQTRDTAVVCTPEMGRIS